MEMVHVLSACECGLLVWLVWHLDIYTRPCFCLMVFVMLAAAAAYRIPRPASEFEASKTIQIVCMTLAALEGIWSASKKDRMAQRIIAPLYCMGFGLLFLIIAKDIDHEFGMFITTYACWLAFDLGMAIGGVSILHKWDLMWFVVLFGLRLTDVIGFWFIKHAHLSEIAQWVVWRKTNDITMLTMAALMIIWLLFTTPTEPTNPITKSNRRLTTHLATNA